MGGEKWEGEVRLSKGGGGVRLSKRGECSNIAVDGSVKMERHLSTLLSLRRRERQICRNADMARAVLYNFIVKVLLYLKIG